MKKRNILLVFIVFIDQLTKILVNKFFKPNESLVIIKKILYITNAHNKGAAWSILSGNTLLLILISILSIYLIYKMTKDYDDLFLGILYGGILGNLIDRLFLGYVRDFINIKIINYPIFNISDICICIGILLLIIKIAKEEKNGSTN